MLKLSSEELHQVEKLNDADRCPMWKFQISILLKASDNFELLSEKRQEDDKTGEKKDDEKTKQWMVKDANAQKIITMTVDRKM